MREQLWTNYVSLFQLHTLKQQKFLWQSYTNSLGLFLKIFFSLLCVCVHSSTHRCQSHLTHEFFSHSSSSFFTWIIFCFFWRLCLMDRCDITPLIFHFRWRCWIKRNYHHSKSSSRETIWELLNSWKYFKHQIHVLFL